MQRNLTGKDLYRKEKNFIYADNSQIFKDLSSSQQTFNPISNAKQSFETEGNMFKISEKKIKDREMQVDLSSTFKS